MKLEQLTQIFKDVNGKYSMRRFLALGFSVSLFVFDLSEAEFLTISGLISSFLVMTTVNNHKNM